MAHLQDTLFSDKCQSHAAPHGVMHVLSVSLPRHVHGLYTGHGQNPCGVVSKNGSGTSFTPDKDNWDATVYVGLNVFDGGEARARVREAKAETQRAAHECEELQRNIDLAIRQAHLQISEADARFALASQAQTQALESKRLTEARYEAGAVISQVLIDAELALVAARQRLITAGFDRELAKVALWHAAGRLTATLLPTVSEGTTDEHRSAPECCGNLCHLRTINTV